MSDADNDAIKLARMQQQMASLVESVGRIERKVDEVVTLDRTIVQLQADAKHAAQEMTTQWGRIDAMQRGINDVDTKVEKWINTGRGAWWTLILLGGAIQAAVAASVFWVITSVQTLRETSAVFENRVSRIEQGPQPRSER